MANKVTCINKIDRNSAYERITHIWWIKDSDGWRFKITQQEAIDYMKSKTAYFYTDINWDRADVIIASRNGREYIKTENDWDEPNNLLSLPEC